MPRAGLAEITEGIAAHNKAHPDNPAAPFAINQIVHKSNDRLEHDMEMVMKYKVPIIITALGAREDVNQAVHSYGGVTLHDVINDRFARKAIEKGADGVIAVTLARRALARDRERVLVLGTAALSVLLTSWCLIRWPGVLAKLSLLTFSQPSRTAPFVGFFGVVLLALLLGVPERRERVFAALRWDGALLLGLGILFLAGWGATVFLQLLDPEAFGGLAALQRQTQWIADACRASRPVDGGPPVRLPGEGGLKRRRRQLEDGIELHPAILPALAPWAQRYGVAAPA